MVCQNGEKLGQFRVQVWSRPKWTRVVTSQCIATIISQALTNRPESNSRIACEKAVVFRLRVGSSQFWCLIRQRAADGSTTYKDQSTISHKKPARTINQSNREFANSKSATSYFKSSLRELYDTIFWLLSNWIEKWLAKVEKKQLSNYILLISKNGFDWRRLREIIWQTGLNTNSNFFMIRWELY